MLQVADNGPGIPAADRQRILQPFVRLERDREQVGSGLGLSLVAAVMRLHRGTHRAARQQSRIDRALSVAAESGQSLTYRDSTLTQIERSSLCVEYWRLRMPRC